MTKEEIIKKLRDMAKYPTVTMPRDTEALRTAADLLEQAEQEPVAWMHTQLDGVVIPHRPADLNRHPERWQALHKIPPTCQTCEALARTVMLDQTSHDISPPQQEPAAYVYKATTQQGEVAYFGVKSTARAWAKSGTVEFLPLKTLKLVQKPCASCESLARTVMLDQTSHDVQLQRKPLTDEEIVRIKQTMPGTLDVQFVVFARAIEAKIKEKNT